jgi:hypothetical protein
LILTVWLACHCWFHPAAFSWLVKMSSISWTIESYMLTCNFDNNAWNSL